MYKVLIANVLKPVDETRMCHKLAGALEQMESLDIHIFGKIRTGRCEERYNSYEYDTKTGAAISRLSVQWIFFRYLMQLRPHLVILETPELILPFLFYRSVNKCLLIYDVLENYRLNHRWSEARKGWSRWLAASVAVVLHTVTAWIADHILLAEKVYAKQLGIEQKCSLLENKAPVFFKNLKHTKKETAEPVKLFFTGSLSPESGVFHCVEMANRLSESGYTLQLYIAGYAQKIIWQKALRKSCANERIFKLYGIEKFVDHRTMAGIMQQCDVALMAYADLPHYAHKRPTKLFEYLALGKPILAHFTLSKLDLKAYEDDIIYVDYVNDSADYMYLQIKKLLLHDTKKRKASALYFDEALLREVVINLLNLPANFEKASDI